MLVLAPLAGSFACEGGAVDRAARKAWRSGSRPKFFTEHEWETVKALADLVIPRDERSGSATDAGVPTFMDFAMSESRESGYRMRGGLAWLDRECWSRYTKSFLDCDAAERTAVLDDIAWPAKAPAALKDGVDWFNSFRDLVASGFWSSKTGVDDLRYIGNVYVAEWKGCPDAALNHLGVHYT